VSASASTRRHEMRAEYDHQTVTVNDRFRLLQGRLLDGAACVEKIVLLWSTESLRGSSGGVEEVLAEGSNG
jgi:hypothetical protein